ncbi:MAG: PhzF family phenazine biosynthesis protein [Cohaesibacter sp.]|nr:PhzF family phenazine biosynthesis protein [Cohaesibacter sp.]
MQDAAARRYVLMDVFTGDALSGNPLAVVLDGDGLESERMQAIAAEFNLSETVFVTKTSNPAHNARLRIFTPTSELPFAGHPTVGSAVLLGMERFPDIEDEQDCMILLEETVGLVRAGVKLTKGLVGEAVFDVPKLSCEVDVTLGSKDEIAAALGLHITDIGFENHVPTAFSAGLPFALIPLKNLQAVQRARPVAASWNTAFGSDEHNCAYLYSRETIRHGSDFHTRMFAPGLGIGEDAATGSAAAAFGGAIFRFDKPGQGTHHYLIEQGFEMGRPSMLQLELDVDAGKLSGQRLGGQAVVVGRGELYL